MIDAGEIHAQIDEAAGMVRFLEDVEQRSDVQVQKRLEQCLHQSMQLDQRLQVVNREVWGDACPYVCLRQAAWGSEIARVASLPADQICEHL